MERLLNRLRPALPALISNPASGGTISDYQPISIHDRQTRRGTKDQTRQQASRASRYVLYEKVKKLQSQGQKILQIARDLKISRKTVRRYYFADGFPVSRSLPRQKSKLDPYVTFLQERWNAGCHQTEQLLKKIEQQGYSGSSRRVQQWTNRRRELLLGGPLRTGRPPARRVELFKVPAPSGEEAKGSPSAALTLPSSRQLVWLLLLSENKLKESEQEILNSLCRQLEIKKARE